MSIFNTAQTTAATAVLQSARDKKLMLATAESCTGGIIAGCLTEIAGSSDVFDRGFITYSYDAKIVNLGVAADTLTTHGAVSEQTAYEMAQGALKHSKAQIALAVTGIAGPGGATPDKPIGLVYIGIANAKTGEVKTIKNNFLGDRAGVRGATLDKALALLADEIALITD